MPGLVEWEAHQRAVLRAENQLLAEAPQVGETGQTVPGIEQWQAQHRAALAAQNIQQDEEEVEQEEEEGSLEPEQRTTETVTTSTSATQTGLKSLLELSFKRLLSKLKPRQKDKQDDDENNNENNTEGENSRTNQLSILLRQKEDESGNSNYLDLLLNSYDKGRQREIPRSFRKPSSSFDAKLFYDTEYYDYQPGDGDRFRFLYEDDSDITFAVKQSRQLNRSLRRFLSKLDKF